MPLPSGVHYLSDVISKQQKMIDQLFWESDDQDDWQHAQRLEREVNHLMKLMEQGEEYYCDF